MLLLAHEIAAQEMTDEPISAPTDTMMETATLPPTETVTYTATAAQIPSACAADLIAIAAAMNVRQ